jgi:hypothetical protein
MQCGGGTKYLDSTKRILMVSGSAEDVDLASQVFAELKRAQRPGPTPATQDQLLALRRKVDSLERQLNSSGAPRKDP